MICKGVIAVVHVHQVFQGIIGGIEIAIAVVAVDSCLNFFFVYGMDGGFGLSFIFLFVLFLSLQLLSTLLLSPIGLAFDEFLFSVVGLRGNTTGYVLLTIVSF